MLDVHIAAILERLASSSHTFKGAVYCGLVKNDWEVEFQNATPIYCDGTCIIFDPVHREWSDWWRHYAAGLDIVA